MYMQYYEVTDASEAIIFIDEHKKLSHRRKKKKLTISLRNIQIE